MKDKYKCRDYYNKNWRWIWNIYDTDELKKERKKVTKTLHFQITPQNQAIYLLSVTHIIL